MALAVPKGLIRNAAPNTASDMSKLWLDEASWGNSWVPMISTGLCWRGEPADARECCARGYVGVCHVFMSWAMCVSCVFVMCVSYLSFFSLSVFVMCVSVKY